VTEFLLRIERHKDLADLCIKTAGIGITLIAGIVAGVKYFVEKRKERMKEETDLRRQAYFDLFTAIPLQLAALGKFVRDRGPVEIPIETYTALHRLHLLASHDALQCIITRNAIYHEGLIEMATLKRRAMQFEASGDERMIEKVANTWEAFGERFKKLVTDLSANYRELLVYAREEIGLKGDMAKILAALERDEKAALAALEQAR
jgi:hypothetical protein